MYVLNTFALKKERKKQQSTTE